MTSEEARHTSLKLDKLSEKDLAHVTVRADKTVENLKKINSDAGMDTGIDDPILKGIIIALIANGIYDAVKHSVIAMSNVFMSTNEESSHKELDPIAPWNVLKVAQKKLDKESNFLLSSYCRGVQLAFQKQIIDLAETVDDKSKKKNKPSYFLFSQQLQRLMQKEAERESVKFLSNNSL
jgi:hypothetical protein